MKINDIKIGDTFVDKLGEAYSIIDKIETINKYEKKSTKFVVCFHETNNYQIVYHSFVGSNHVHDYSKPYIYGIGYAKGTKDNPIEIDSSNYGSYQFWYNMILRCYKNGNGLKSYKDVTVCQDWHNYSNFKNWFENNAPKCFEHEIHLDKDLFAKDVDSKIYSPDNCCFLPKEINACITCLNKLKEDNITDTSAKSIYHLSLLVEKFDYLLSSKVKSKLEGVVKLYKKKYKKITGRSLSTDFRDLHLKKADLSKITIISFLKIGSRVYEFNNIKELKDFVIQTEREEELKIKPCLITST